MELFDGSFAGVFVGIAEFTVILYRLKYKNVDVNLRYCDNNNFISF